MAIPELVRQAALFPELDLPDPPPEHPYEVVHGKGYSVGIFPDLSFGQVSVSAIAEDVIERTIEDARSVLATYGMSQGAWMVPEAASPAGLATDLRRLGMVSYEEPPLEPRFAAMVAVSPPEPGRPDTEARLTRTFEEFQAGHRLAGAAFDESDDDRRAYEAQERRLWDRSSSNSGSQRSAGSTAFSTDSESSSGSGLTERAQRRTTRPPRDAQLSEWCIQTFGST